MKFPKINEYDMALLVVIAWIMVWIYPALSFPVELDTVTLYLIIPNFTLAPILWVLIRSKINTFLKVFLLFTSWFAIVAAAMVISATLGTASPSGNVVLSGSTVQPLLGAGVLLMLLTSLRKARLRWFNFITLTTWWAIYLPKSFNASWTMFDPSNFFFGDFISFILPMILYLYLVELRKSEGRVIAYMGKHIKGHRRIRVFRLGHFGGYIALIVIGMFLTLNLFFLKLFGPSAYLLMSVELTSPTAWLLLAFITIAILVLVPVAAMFAGKKVTRLISRR